MKRILFGLLSLLLGLPASAVVIDTISVVTPNIPTPINAIVVTPSTLDSTKRFPTVYILNGHGGNHKSWLDNQKQLPGLAEKYGMVMVFPDGRDSWYWDTPKMKMESFIVNDLVPYIDSHYPTIPDSTKRAITGLSMGGHGAMWLGFRHPDIWKNVGSISGGVDVRKFPNNWKISTLIGEYEADKAKWDAHTVRPLAGTIEPGRFNIIFDCGTEDFFYEVNEDLHQALLDRKVPHDYISRPGQHNWPYWNNSILYQLLYFNEIFK